MGPGPGSRAAIAASRAVADDGVHVQHRRRRSTDRSGSGGFRAVQKESCGSLVLAFWWGARIALAV